MDATDATDAMGTEAAERRGGAGLLLWRRSGAIPGSVDLLVIEGRDGYEDPGGKAEPGEDSYGLTAVREFLEETRSKKLPCMPSDLDAALDTRAAVIGKIGASGTDSRYRLFVWEAPLYEPGEGGVWVPLPTLLAAPRRSRIGSLAVFGAVAEIIARGG
jgi:8-oxo-dGTP pyrophosphatase MutT (NUDIX family)